MARDYSGYPSITFHRSASLFPASPPFLEAQKKSPPPLHRAPMTPRQVILTGLTVFLLGFELLVLAILALSPYLPDARLSTFNMDIYLLLAPFSTVFLSGLLYAWLVKLGTREARRRFSTLRSFVRFLSEPSHKMQSSVRNTSLTDSARTFRILSRPRLMLCLSLATSVLIAFIPYRPDLNPTGSLVGIDSSLYVTWINQMLARPLPQALQYSFVAGLEGSRPLLLVLLYGVASLGISPSQIIEYLPMILAPLLSLSSYVFVRFGQGSAGLAGLTALLTPFSFYVTVGLWGGYYANMLALIFVYLFLTLLLLFSKSPSTPKYGAMLILSVALFLTHPWTWILIVTTCLVFAVSVWKETGHAVQMESMIGIFIAGLALDLLKSLVFATRTVAADLATKLPTSGQVASFWTNLVDALLYTHGGLLGNWTILALGLFAAFALRFRNWFERLLILWVGVASIPFLVLDSYHQARILYDLPIPVLTSLALVFFLPQLVARNVQWPGLVLVLLLVVSANYALQSILLL